MKSTYIKYQFLNNFREPSNVFWTMAYPLIMALLFFIAFQGFLDPEPLNIQVGVETGSPAAQAFAGIDILEVIETTRPEALDLIGQNKLTAFVDQDLAVTVGRSGLEETVIASITSQMVQMQALDVPPANFDFSASYVQTMNSRSNPFLIPFYSLIGMVSLYSVYMGLEHARFMQADQSTVAQRMNVVPLTKSGFITGSLLIGITMNLLSNLLLLAFMKLVLGLTVVTDYPRSLAVLLSANLVGISLGLFIGASNNAGDGAKNGMVIGSTLTMAFLAGMMSPDIKVLMENSAPLLALLNPVNIVSTELYRINYLDITSTFGRGILILLCTAGLFLVLSQVFLRRKTYDSL